MQSQGLEEEKFREQKEKYAPWMAQLKQTWPAEQYELVDEQPWQMGELSFTYYLFRKRGLGA